MLREIRLQYILDKLKSEGKVSSLSLSKELDVSDDTIRRDLNELAEQGLIKKVHGGAVPKSAYPLEYNQRLNVSQQEKQILAEKSLKLFKNGQLVIIDGGPTNQQVAKILPPDLRLTVYTNSLPIATELLNHPLIEVVFLGGKIFKYAQVAIGLEVIEALNKIKADWCLLGICSSHYETGITIPDREESQVKHKIVEVSDQVVALANASKIGTAENYKVCEIADVDLLITDFETDKIHLPAYKKAGLEIW